MLWKPVGTTVLPVLTLGADGSVVGPLAGHVVYGVALGTLYPLVRRYV